MYQLLVVDDERSVVESISLTVEWFNYGITEVFQALSAAEALEIIQRHSIDIVITDIQMPEMDGLQLISQIKSFAPNIHCIVLSGYDDFSFAQKALKYQAVDYLLKPVDFNDLIASVEKTVKEIEKKWIQISSVQRLEVTLRENLPLLKEKLLNDLIKNQSIQREILTQRLKLLDISFQSGDEFAMLVIRLEDDFSGYDLQSLSVLEFAVTNIAEEVLKDKYDLWHCVSEQGYLILMLKEKERGALRSVDSFAVKLQEHVHVFLKGNISVYVSEIDQFPTNISQIYNRALSSISENIGNNKSFFITYKDTIFKNSDKVFLNLYEPPILPNLLESGNWEEALQKIRNMLKNKANDWELNHLNTVFLYLASSFSYVLQKEDILLEGFLGEEYNLFIKKPSQISSQRLYDWSEKIIIKLKEETIKYMADAHHQLVGKIQSYIHQNLAEGISLQTISDYIGLHPVYLSKVYKSVTGETVGDYLYSVRIEKANYLLTYTDLKISEVSFKLGFQTSAHFIKVFKKHYGIPPQEFRINQKQCISKK